jgi:hypothetical protein
MKVKLLHASQEKCIICWCTKGETIKMRHFDKLNNNRPNIREDEKIRNAEVKTVVGQIPQNTFAVISYKEKDKDNLTL